MSMYIEMIRVRFLMMLAYRTNYYSGILIYSINIGAYYFLWSAIYGGKEEIQGLSVAQMTTYVAVAWMARAFYYNNIDREIAAEIKDGKVAIEMIRPYNYLGMKTMQALGEGVFRLLFFSVPGMIIVALIFPVRFDASLTTWLFFFISLIFSFIVNTHINLLTGIMTFFLFNNSGLIRAKRVVIDLFSGLLLPISFYPGWAQDVMSYLPFQAISYVPSMIFTEGFVGQEIYNALLSQVFWVVILLIPIRLLWSLAKKHLIVQGGRPMFYLSLFFQYASQYLKTRLTYRVDTIIEILSDLLFQGVNLIFIVIVFRHTAFLGGWNQDEIIFIYGFFLVPYALFSSFFNIWDFNERYIVKGEMDRILTRPVHSLFQIILERIELESLFGAITGLLVMGYAIMNLGLTFAWYDVLIFIVLVIGGAFIYAGIFISIATIGFWSDSRTDIMPMMYNISNYGRYPINIYNKVIQFVLTWILPFAFVGVYPASYFLNREEWYGYAFFTPVMGILFFGIAILLWNAGVKRYRGLGN